jgi:hypothetical protein
MRRNSKQKSPKENTHDIKDKITLDDLASDEHRRRTKSMPVVTRVPF